MDEANKLAIEANRLAIEGHSPTPKELDLAAKLPVAPEIQIRRTGMHAQTQVQMNLQANRRRAVTVQQDFEWFHGACQQTGKSREGPRKLLSMVDADVMVTVLRHVVAGMKCTSSVVWQ
jgi:hypothetical protein